MQLNFLLTLIVAVVCIVIAVIFFSGVLDIKVGSLVINFLGSIFIKFAGLGGLFKGLTQSVFSGLAGLINF